VLIRVFCFEDPRDTPRLIAKTWMKNKRSKDFGGHSHDLVQKVPGTAPYRHWCMIIAMTLFSKIVVVLIVSIYA